MTKLLPSTPNLHHLCTQAKDLLTLCRLSDPSAIKLIKAHCHALANAGSVRVAERIKLSDAQHAIARSYGFTCWASLSATANKRQNDVQSLSKALTDPRMENLSYRLELARKKGLPEIGTSHVSEHGVRYDVVDYMIAMAPCRPERSSSGGLQVHIDDFLPIIAFPEMSDRLRELYIETDCVTTKPLVFFDTLPAAHPATAAPGLNQALTINAEAPIHLLFDAASVHETIIAHELGHIWVEKVEQREDYRHLRDQSDTRRVTQFSHIQSFVMDLCVNDMLMRRGFDVSIIARHEAEGILHFAANCARGEKPKNKRVLAGVISALAGAMLEMERFPDDWAPDVKDALEVLHLRLPEAFEPAMGFVRSVLCHGYHDSAAIMQAVDDCAAISFAATGEDFDPDRDLIEVPNVEPNWDKRPSFLACLPIGAKIDVCKETAKRGITGTAKYDVVVSRDTHANVTVSGLQDGHAELINLSFTLTPPPGRRFMQADSALGRRAGAQNRRVPAATASLPRSSSNVHMPLPLHISLPGEQNPIGHLAGVSLSNIATAGQPGFVPAHVLQARRINEQLAKQRLDDR